MVKALAADGISVISLARRASSPGDTEIDLLDTAALGRVVADADVVIHAAGKTGDIDDDTNEQLAESVGRACHNGPPIINLSSVAVYGDVPTRRVDEATMCNPVSNYGRSKLLAEKLLERHAQRVCHLRIANVYSDGYFARLHAQPRQRFIRANEVSNIVFGTDVAALVVHLVARIGAHELPPVINVVRPDVGHIPHRILLGPEGWRGSALRVVPSSTPHLVRRLRRLPSLPNKIFVSSVIERMDFAYPPIEHAAPASWHQAVSRHRATPR